MVVGNGLGFGSVHVGRFRRRGKVKALEELGKKFVAFLFSHVGLCGLVLGYTMLGSVLFRAIEGPHERDTHRHVRSSRSRAVDGMWASTFLYNVKLDIWTSNCTLELHDFKWVLLKIIQKGYDANDQEDNTQWTFSGAFLYSLTVITTIGYGNIACRTAFGKAMTICYAILGIPLMLLFLTNIGDILAKVFKFLYRKTVHLRLRMEMWNKRRKARQVRRANSLLSAKLSTHQAPYSPRLQQLTEPLLGGGHTDSGTTSLASASATPEQKPRGKTSTTVTPVHHKLSRHHHGQMSVGSHLAHPQRHHQHHRTSTSSGGSLKGLGPMRRGASPTGTLLRPNHQAATAAPGASLSLDTGAAVAPTAVVVTSRSASLMPSTAGDRTMMLANNEDLSIEQIRLETLAQRLELDHLSMRESTDEKLAKLTVPLWLVLFVMITYLMGGAVLFTVWEGWSFFSSFYFCFVSLATIGFGDLFPGTSLKDAGSSQEKLIITSLYLLLGMALIAMCFNLAQEEVVNKMTRVAGKLGIIHHHQQQHSDQDVSIYGEAE